MILASVVFPEPGGPQKMHDPISPRRISSPRGFPGPSRCSWPRNSSRVLGRILAAKGSPDRWNSVGSDTGEWGKGNGETQGRKLSHRVRSLGTAQSSRISHSRDVKQLNSLEAWTSAQELARAAYRLTLDRPLSRHFGLVDQIRRAAISVPANM